MSNSDMDSPPREYAPQGYALSGKIMLSAIIILFTVVILIVCFHIYARWFLQHHHRPQPSDQTRNRRRRRHRRNHRTHFIFTSNQLPNGTVSAVSRGLDSNALESIPVFTYSHQKNDQNGGGAAQDGGGGGGGVLECAVCLSEFEENETGRILPKCRHSFHVECIDMWFHSHSTCPLCRTPVTPETSSESATVHELTQIVIDSSTEHDGSGSNQPCTSCRNEGSSSSVSGSCSSSSSSVLPLSIEVRKTEESLKSLVEETAGQGMKSPGSRMLSLKRILSRERRMSSMSNSLSFCSHVTDNIDHDKDDEDNQVQVQIQQPSQRFSLNREDF